MALRLLPVGGGWSRGLGANPHSSEWGHMSHSTAWRLVLACALVVVAGALGRGAAAEEAAAGTEPAASSAPYMLDARVVGDESRMRFVADMSATVNATVFALADPYRIIIDLPEVRFVLPDAAGSEGRGFISAFRYGSISEGKSRIVIDVTGPVAIDKQFTVEPADGQPARFVLDVVPTTRDKFLAAAKAYRESHAVADDKRDRAPVATGDAALPLIVLDPGHCGIDLGARGDGGTLEKDVVLAFARVLGEKLLATGRYRVAYTRTDDTFIALGERVQIARRQNADP